MKNTARLVDPRFTTLNPYSQNDLRVLERVGRPSDVTIENGYHIPGEKIFCHACGAYRHNWGLTGSLSDGSRILFGRHCAGNYFGHDVINRAWKDFKLRKERAATRTLVERLAETSSAVLEWLDSYGRVVLQIRHAWLKIDEKHSGAKQELMREIGTSGGRIKESHVIHKVTFLETKGSKYLEDQVTIATIRSPEAMPWIEDSDRLIREIRGYFLKLSDPDLSEEDAFRLVNLGYKFRRQAEQIDSVWAFGVDLFSPNLETICELLDRKRRSQLTAKHKIVRERNLPEGLRRVVGHGYEAPAKSLTEILRALPPELNSKS